MLTHAKIVLTLVIAFSFLACGYKPSAQFAREVMGDKISTSVVISAADPENTVIIKDAVDTAILEQFHASLSTREHSDTHLKLSISDPIYTPNVYDKDGYVIGYKMKLYLSITRYYNGKSKNYKTKGVYDFAVTPNAVLTDQERFDAIKFSAAKAIDAFLAQVSAEGTKR